MVPLEYQASHVRSPGVIEAFLGVEASPWGNCYLKTEYTRALCVDLAWPGHLHSLLGNFPFRIQLAWQMKTRKTHTHTHTHAHTHTACFLSLFYRSSSENPGLSLESYQQMSLLGLKARLPHAFVWSQLGS